MINKIKAIFCVLLCLLCVNATSIKADITIRTEGAHGDLFDDFWNDFSEKVNERGITDELGARIEEMNKTMGPREKCFLLLVFDEKARSSLSSISRSAIRMLNEIREHFREHFVDANHHFHKAHPKDNEAVRTNDLKKDRLVEESFYEVMAQFVNDKDFELKMVDDGGDINYYFVAQGANVAIANTRSEKIQVDPVEWNKDELLIAERGTNSDLTDRKNLKHVSTVIFLFNPASCYKEAKIWKKLAEIGTVSPDGKEIIITKDDMKIYRAAQMPEFLIGWLLAVLLVVLGGYCLAKGVGYLIEGVYRLVEILKKKRNR